ncbi:hypothetical protein ES705_27824 [subsurface metagenome]
MVKIVAGILVVIGIGGLTAIGAATGPLVALGIAGGTLIAGLIAFFKK